MINVILAFIFAQALGANDLDTPTLNSPVTDLTICAQWHAQVDPALPSCEVQVEELDDQELLQAIECLLMLEGRKETASFWGATDPRSSLISGPCAIEIAALYYISYLFTGKWDHALNVALMDEEGELNTDQSVVIAYRSYRAWFAVVRQVGLDKARQQQLDPMHDSGVHWY
ncbi:hypothetical protein ACFLU6_16610 [Acidobacteriota bacterium]